MESKPSAKDVNDDSLRVEKSSSCLIFSQMQYGVQ